MMITSLPFSGAFGLVCVAGAELSRTPDSKSKQRIRGEGEGSGDGVKEIIHPEAWVRGSEEDSAPWCAVSAVPGTHREPLACLGTPLPPGLACG